jgi:hypothetical protein
MKGGEDIEFTLSQMSARSSGWAGVVAVLRPSLWTDILARHCCLHDNVRA